MRTANTAVTVTNPVITGGALVRVCASEGCARPATRYTTKTGRVRTHTRCNQCRRAA